MSAMFAHTDESRGWLLRATEALPAESRSRLALAMAGIAERNLANSEVARLYAKLIRAERERQVLMPIAHELRSEGWSYRDIAAQLGVSATTAREYVLRHECGAVSSTEVRRQRKADSKTASSAGVG